MSEQERKKEGKAGKKAGGRKGRRAWAYGPLVGQGLGVDQVGQLPPLGAALAFHPGYFLRLHSNKGGREGGREKGRDKGEDDERV